MYKPSQKSLVIPVGILIIMVGVSNIVGIAASVMATTVGDNHDFSWAVFGGAFAISMLLLANIVLIITACSVVGSIIEK